MHLVASVCLCVCLKNDNMGSAQLTLWVQNGGKWKSGAHFQQLFCWFLSFLKGWTNRRAFVLCVGPTLILPASLVYVIVSFDSVFVLSESWVIVNPLPPAFHSWQLCHIHSYANEERVTTWTIRAHLCFFLFFFQQGARKNEFQEVNQPLKGLISSFKKWRKMYPLIVRHVNLPFSLGHGPIWTKIVMGGSNGVTAQ